MDTASIHLTEEEASIILEHRAKQAKIAKTKEQTRLLLDCAATYGIWLLETGNKSTYSTFCDYNGFDTAVLEDRSQAYNFIMGIIQLAKDYAADVGTVTYQ